MVAGTPARVCAWAAVSATQRALTRMKAPTKIIYRQKRRLEGRRGENLSSWTGLLA